MFCPIAAFLRFRLPCRQRRPKRCGAGTAGVVLRLVHPAVEKPPDAVPRLALAGIAQAPCPGFSEFPGNVHPRIGHAVFPGQRLKNGKLRPVGKRDECDGPLPLRRRMRGGCASIARRKMRSICLSLFFLLFSVLLCSGGVTWRYIVTSWRFTCVSRRFKAFPVAVPPHTFRRAVVIPFPLRLAFLP